MNYAHLHPKCIDSRSNLVLYERLFDSGKAIGGQHKLISGKDKIYGFAKVVVHTRVRNVEVKEM